MADIAISLIVRTVAERVSIFLINESAALGEVVTEVEWIERELRLMQAFLEHIERHRQGEEEEEEEGIDEWAEDLRDVATEAKDVIETFIYKSVKRRRIWLLYWWDKYKVGKELERISSNMRDLSQRRTNYEQTNIRVTIEPPGESSTSPTTPTPRAIVEKLSHVLSQNWVTRPEVIKIVEQVRDEYVSMHNVVSNLQSTGESSQRVKAWLKEVTGVCNLTVHAVEDFTSRKRSLASEKKLRKKMKYILSQIGDAFHRNVIYGVGEEDVGDRKGSRSVALPSISLKSVIRGQVPFLIIYGIIYKFSSEYPILYSVIVPGCLILFIVALPILIVRLCKTKCKTKEKKKLAMRALNMLLFGVISYSVLFIVSVDIPLWETVLFFPFEFVAYELIVWTLALWRSVDKNLEDTRKDLELMRALFSDVCADGMDERQKVWMNQLRVVARHAEYLTAHAAAYQKGRGFNRLIYARKIICLLQEIHNVSERKTIYGIANVKGRKELVSSGQSTQESGSEVNTSVVEHNHNSGIEQHSPAPVASLQNVHEYHPVTGLKAEVESIRGEKQVMDALFNDVQNMGELDGRSTVWVEQMKGIALEIEFVINEYATKLEHKPIHIHILNCGTRFSIEKKINRIRKAIRDASRRRKTYGSVQFQTRAESFSMVQRLRRRSQPSLIAKDSSVVGFDDDVEVLVSQLLSDEERRCITLITGIGGTGKTTLARLIFDNHAVMDHFHYRVWVSVPQNYTVELLLEDTAKQIIGDQDVRVAEDLAQILKTYLTNKRYLIVVDNIQTSQVWDSLQKIIPDMSTGCRVILISRNPNEILNAGPRTFVPNEILNAGPRPFVHHLQLLNDEDSQVLFRRNLQVAIPHEPGKVENDIVIKCGGLPSGIIKMANIFSHVTYEEWSRVIEQLNEDKTPWFETLPTIDMNLPLRLRRRLFYFLLFPAEFEIPARRLVALWVAEGLVHRGMNGESPEFVAERYLTELIDLNMVQIAKRKHNGKVKTCRIPNALHQLWLMKAKESNFFLHGHIGTNSISNSNANSFIIRRVVDHLKEDDIYFNHIHGDNGSSSTSLRTYYKDVLSFLSFDVREGSKSGDDIGNFLNYCISSNCFLLLRVLDLEHVYKPQLPNNIGRLSQLRYLGLRWTYLDLLPSSISNLVKLQTLDLKHTYINTLTSSIWKMQLRHLYLSETYRSKFPPQPKGSTLFDLQTLWGLFIHEESPVKGGLDKLVNIRKLGLTCQSLSSQQEAMNSQLDAVADWLLKLEHLQSLRLKSKDEEGRPRNLHLKSLSNLSNLTDMYLLGILSSSSILSHFPPSIVELTLSHSKLFDDPMQILNDFPHLRSLSLLSESYMGKTVFCAAGSFPELRILKIWKLELLEKWHIEEGALPNLRQLEIRSCECLEMLPDGLQHVKTLLELKVTNMPMQFKNRIWNSNSEDLHKVSHIPNVYMDG